MEEQRNDGKTGFTTEPATDAAVMAVTGSAVSGAGWDRDLLCAGGNYII